MNSAAVLNDIGSSSFSFNPKLRHKRDMFCSNLNKPNLDTFVRNSPSCQFRKPQTCPRNS